MEWIDPATAVAACIGLLALVLAGAFGWRALRRRLRARASARAAAIAPAPPARTSPRHPIVLAHGFMGFDVLALPGVRHEYFRGVRGHLEELGCKVYAPRVSPIAGVKRRAEQLAEQLARIEDARVNVVAHSMGALDARYAIARLGMSGRVASLTTIGAPHRGTALADAFASPAARFGELIGLRSWLARVAPQLDWLRDLTSEQMASFNQNVPDARGVLYMSYVGWVPAGSADLHALLAPGHSLMNRIVGDNDGIVPAQSQRWGEIVGEISADHWAQIGWSRGPDVRELYAQLARILAERDL